jgi:hypothetical protein
MRNLYSDNMAPLLPPSFTLETVSTCRGDGTQVPTNRTVSVPHAGRSFKDLCLCLMPAGP